MITRRRGCISPCSFYCHWLLVTLLYFSGYFITAAPFYEIHGHLPSIRPDDLAPESYDRHDETLRSHLQYLLSSKFVSSVIDKIRIHGEEVGKPTAIFYAYLETTEKVEAATLQKSKEMELFFFRERSKSRKG